MKEKKGGMEASAEQKNIKLLLLPDNFISFFFFLFPLNLFLLLMDFYAKVDLIGDNAFGFIAYHYQRKIKLKKPVLFATSTKEITNRQNNYVLPTLC